MPKDNVFQEAKAAFLREAAESAAMCKLNPYRRRSVPSVRVSKGLVLYASPDSTYAVTRRVFDKAERSILIGIYDLTAGYVKEWLLSAIQRGVAVSLMLDVSLTSSGDEATMFRELGEKGVETVPAPSCTSRIQPTFHHSHEKVIVVDERWCFVQSGNYSRASIPRNLVDGGEDDTWVPGNRDTGILFESEELSAFFTKVLRRDMRIVTGARAAPRGAVRKAASPPLVAAAPTKVPAHRPSREISLAAPLTVQPVLTPDNYLEQVEAMLEEATTSILIEQQYIRVSQLDVRRLLDAILKTRNRHPGLKVRIILAGPSFGPDPKIRDTLRELRSDYGLIAGSEVRLLDNAYFAHCHNKLVIIDNAVTLVSSQNWSETALSTNREAGVIVRHDAVAGYFTEIFEEDWKTALHAYPASWPALRPARALASGRTIPITLSDYEDV